MLRKIVFVVLITLSNVILWAQNPSDERAFPRTCRVQCSQFLYDTASFPSCHAATVAELPNGDLVAAFFGGSYEGCRDVCIWMCRKGMYSRAATASRTMLTALRPVQQELLQAIQ